MPVEREERFIEARTNVVGAGDPGLYPSLDASSFALYASSKERSDAARARRCAGGAIFEETAAAENHPVAIASFSLWVENQANTVRDQIIPAPDGGRALICRTSPDGLDAIVSSDRVVRDSSEVVRE